APPRPRSLTEPDGRDERRRNCRWRSPRRGRSTERVLHPAGRAWTTLFLSLQRVYVSIFARTPLCASGVMRGASANFVRSEIRASPGLALIPGLSAASAVRGRG